MTSLQPAFLRWLGVALFGLLLHGMARPEAAALQLRCGEAAYLVQTPASPLEQLSQQRLLRYLTAVLRTTPTLAASLAEVPAGAPAIVLQTGPGAAEFDDSGSTESFVLATRKQAGHPTLLAAGRTPLGLKQAVQRLVIRSRQTTAGLEWPPLALRESPWIPRREWTNTPWKPERVRGIYSNPNADPRLNILLFSDDQLNRYVDMFDAMGFNGGQLMETCYSYGLMGSPEAFQDRQRKLARRLHANGQQVSLWVWAAQFTGFGWYDRDVNYYPQPGRSAFADPTVRASFEKYYDIYARLAPDVDQLILHYFDPGALEHNEDIFAYTRLLEAKFRAVNPRIKMAVDSWGKGPEYIEALAKNGFGGYMLLANAMPTAFKPGEREKLYALAERLGMGLGVWSWYMTEYETDQLASMYVNANLYHHFLNELRKGVLAGRQVPYWSEMEAHHINNLYTMYAAGQLLWNPERDPRELIDEVAEAVWGPQLGPRVAVALRLIQSLRSGDVWNAYWWTMPEYKLGSGDPAQDERELAACLADLRALRADPNYVPKIPLPHSPDTLIELMLPHLEQMRLFALFRTRLAALERQAEAGATTETLARGLAEAYQPIPDFNTWVGNFGQIEQRLQRQQAMDFAKRRGVPLRDPEWLRDQLATRILENMRLMQAAQTTTGPAQLTWANFGLWSDEQMADSYKKLIERGVVRRKPGAGDFFILDGWEAFTNPALLNSHPLEVQAKETTQ